MPTLTIGDLDIAFEVEGPESGVPVLLVCGLGMQLIDWPDHFVAPFLSAGHRVIRFDNRDAGLSSGIDQAPADPNQVIETVLGGGTAEVAYTLSDMAADAVGVLDGIGVESAHVLGVSMGGMISQTIAIEHRPRTRSLTSIMSTTGNPEVGQPTPEAMEAILTPAPGDSKEERISQGLEVARIWASPAHYDETYLRATFEASWDRVGGVRAVETQRQLCAILASPARDEALGTLDGLPATVVHGTADTLITQSGGEHTAACLPDANFVLVDGMGHDLPKGLIGDIVGPVLEQIDRTESRRAA